MNSEPQSVAAGQAKYPSLFSPFEMRGHRLRNRIMHASMTTRYVKDGAVTQALLNYHANRARGGAAAIVTEPLNMLARQKDGRRPDVFGGANQDGLKQWVEAVEREDCRLIGQVQDGGRARQEEARAESSLGVSPLPDDVSWSVPHAMSTGEVVRMVEEFTASSALLKQAGFSGIEISAGHGHLFHQFLSAWSNRREDIYGGDVDGRTRLVRDLIAAIRAECGGNFIIGLKLPGEDGVPGGIDLDESERIARAVAATGEVDYWTFAWGTHAQSLHWHLPDLHGPRTPYMDKIARLRAVAPEIPTGALGLITDPNEAERVLSDGTADLAMLGRPLITDPAWPNKVFEDREAEIRYCVSCNSCWGAIIVGGQLRCDNNPRVGQADEADWWPVPAKARKKVVVVGAGVAGMEAAWVAAARGHDVTVFCASAEVGGKTRLHAELPGGENLSSIYDYQWLAANRAGAKVELGVSATLDDVLALSPDKVVLAAGSDMSWPDFLPEEYRDEGVFPDLRALSAMFVERPVRQPGRLVIYDKDQTEMTYAAAEFFAGLFDEVVLVTPRERIATDVPLVNRQGIYRRLYEKRVRIITSSEPLAGSAFEEGNIRIANIYNGDEVEIDDIAMLSFATPRVPSDALRAPLEERGINVSLIGDCYAPRGVMAATREGHTLGESL